MAASMRHGRRARTGSSWTSTCPRDGVWWCTTDRRLESHDRATGSVRDRKAAELASSTCRRCATCWRAIRARKLSSELKEHGADLARAVIEEVRRADAVDRVCLGR